MNSAKMVKKALKLELKKRYAEAALIHEEVGNLEKAAFMYAKSNNIQKSAQLLNQAGNFKKAAELYLQIDDFTNAAELFTKAHDFGNAGRAFVHNGQLEIAAKMFEKANNLKEAAKIYLVLRNFMKAGELFEKSGDLINSARTYEMMIDQREVEPIEQKKDRDRIAALLMRVKRFEKAAEIYLLSQEITEAILMYLKVNDIPAAVRLYINCQGDVGSELLETVNYDDQEGLNNYIKLFDAAKDFKKAGIIAERMGDHYRAAQFYAQSSDFDLAAEMFLEGGYVEQAAAMHIKAGNMIEAGRLFENIGNSKQAAHWFENGQAFFKAGKLYYQIGRYDKAVELLQKIKSNDENFLEASELISSIFSKKGMVDLAIQRYRKVVEETSINDKSVDFYYRLARILLEKKSYHEAETIVKAIISHNPDYKDADQLLQNATKMAAQLKEKSDLFPALEYTPEKSSENNIEQKIVDIATRPSVTDSIVIGRREGFEFLKKTSLFESLNLQEMKLIWEICETIKYNKGNYIIQDDTPGQAFYIIKQGSVTVRKSDEEGDEILAHLLPGEHFGEMAIIDTSNTSASIIAEEEVEVFQIKRELFQKLLENHERIALKVYSAFLKTLCQRLRISSDKVVYLKSCLET
ncbi:cyclic nucleotide-binding domain-containing protein [candidate division CSSED10-310 bacterium]|uniref:Cyclic nucleotide-binding domain-containing protein n=1 Tax=candidate division CSSED10-310 bacterium TaxID=2855610 RepID=A0ABV6YW08_UNCC1